MKKKRRGKWAVEKMLVSDGFNITVDGGTIAQTWGQTLKEQEGIAVGILALPELLDSQETLLSLLQEAHQAEVDDGHGGDNPKDCTYCQAISEAVKLLQRIEKGKLPKADPALTSDKVVDKLAGVVYAADIFENGDGGK